jgi:hypothetical protein
MFGFKKDGIIEVFLRPLVCFFLLFGPEDADDMFLRNIRGFFFQTAQCYNTEDPVSSPYFLCTDFSAEIIVTVKLRIFWETLKCWFLNVP